MGDLNGPYAANGGPGSVIAARMAIEDFGGKVLGKNIEQALARAAFGKMIADDRLN